MDQLWQEARPAFGQYRVWQEAHRHLLGSIACLGRHTITGVICAHAGQHNDWSKVYRLFEHERFDQDKLFAPVRQAVCRQLPSTMPVIASLDDTLLRKRGKHVCGASWRRDPMGPPFRPNFVWAQRFVQMSLIAPSGGFASNARAIPVDVVHAPTPQKPRKQASEDDWRRYRLEQQAMRVSTVGAQRIAHLRAQLSSDCATAGRSLVVAVDGGYTNHAVFHDIPDNTILIGRVRKDSRLFAKPSRKENSVGRTRLYGNSLPTPEQMRQDHSIPWTQVNAYAAGKVWDFDVKVVKELRWKAAGGRDLQLVIIRPIAYRRTKGCAMDYRNPAYLICTDPNLSIEQLLQAYLWRWEIEVNFREEKTIMGAGQAQVRTKAAVQATTAFAVASYAMLHVAALRLGLKSMGLPPPKWRQHVPPKRSTTNQLVSRVRAELWGSALGVNFSDFVKNNTQQRSHHNTKNCLAAAVLYATG